MYRYVCATPWPKLPHSSLSDCIPTPTAPACNCQTLTWMASRPIKNGWNPPCVYVCMYVCRRPPLSRGARRIPSPSSSPSPSPSPSRHLQCRPCRRRYPTPPKSASPVTDVTSRSSVAPGRAATTTPAPVIGASANASSASIAPVSPKAAPAYTAQPTLSPALGLGQRAAPRARPSHLPRLPGRVHTANQQPASEMALTRPLSTTMAIPTLTQASTQA